MTINPPEHLDARAILATAACDPDSLGALLYSARPAALRHAIADVAETSVALLLRAGLDHRAAMDLIQGHRVT